MYLPTVCNGRSHVRHWRVVLICGACLVLNLVTPAPLAARSLLWIGATNGVPANDWDIGITTNWLDLTDGTPTTYTQSLTVGDSVSFSDVSSNGVVTLTTTLLPASVAVSNNTLPYQIGGPGTLSGTGGLSKQGTGSLELSSANSYSGGTSNLEGTLQIGHDGALGTGLVIFGGGSLSSDSTAARTLTNNILVTTATTLGNAANNGVLTLGGTIELGDAAQGLTISSPVVCTGHSGNGRIHKLGSRTLTLTGTADWTGTAEVRNGTLVLDGAAFTNSAATRVDASQANGSARLVITNGAVLVLNGNGTTLRAGFDGNTTATNFLDIAGVVRIPNADSDNGWLALGRAGTRGIVSLWPDGDLEVRGVASSDSGAAAGYSEFNFRGGVLRARDSRATFMEGLTNAFVRSGGAIIDSAGCDITIVQSLLNGGGGGGLVKTGTGSLRLAGTNTYTGATVVGAGILALSPANYAAAGALTVSNGAAVQLDIGSPATLNVSDLTLGNGGSVALTLNYGILSANPASAAVAVTGNTVAGGTNVIIHLVGAGFTNGQFTLIDYAGSLGGNGFGAFKLGSLPANVDASLVNNTNNSSIDLQVSLRERTNTLPNLLLIVSDDAGYHDFSMQGSTNFPTPRIDALATEGVRFTCGYTCGAVCSPTRASIMTGRYQHRYGHDSNPAPPSNRGLSTNEVTLAQLLKSAGYYTGCVGKWHLGELPHYYPTARGFDFFYGFLGGARSYDPISNPASYQVIQSNGVPTIEGSYTTDRFGQAAANFIQMHASEPWFLYLTFNAVHGPLDADPARLERLTNYTYSTTDRRTEAAMTLALDDNVGLVLDTLQALNLATNTLVAFVNDNGGVSGRDNTPLRDFKGSLYEGGIRVPYMLRWPGLIPTNQVSPEPVITLDLLPTLLAAAGATPPTNHPLDGVNLLPLVLGQTNRLPREPLFFWRTGGRTAGQSAVRKGDWKLHRVDSTGQPELYQLNPDGTGEYTNLATNNPQKVLELMALYDQWEAQTPEPFWGNGAVTTLNGAWADSSDLGWLLDAATNRPAYALTTLREPIKWNEDLTLAWRMETTGARTDENGYIAFGPGAAESSLIRAGLERSPGRLVIAEPGGVGESELTGLTFPAGVLELELAYAVADNSLTLRWGTNTLKRILSTAYASVTHLGYAVWQAQTRFGFFEVRPATRLILHDPATPSIPGAAFQFSVQIERQVPGNLILERAAVLPSPFTPLTNPPQLYLGGKLFQFQDASGAADAGFYRVRSSP